MRGRALPGIIALFLVLLFCGQAQARPVHHFECNVCHKAGVGSAALGGNNICLQCHKDPKPEMTFADGSAGHAPRGTFSVQDASNAMNAATAAGMEEPPSQQTSHYWASPKDVVPAAGALAPTAALYRSRYGISNGKVTCTRCHDPHLRSDSDPKLLRLGSTDSMCLNCHRPWNKGSSDRGLESHPLVVDYPAFAASRSDKYKPVSYNASTLVLGTNAGSGGVRLVYNATAGTHNISCSSCHGLHFTDSDSSTLDGRDLAGSLNAGDGKLLLSDGPRPGTDSALDYSYNSAVLRSNLCQTCHTYQIHGRTSDGGPVIGCLDCHSGHSYNGGTPYFFVLRKAAFNPLYNSSVSFGGYQDGATHYAYNSAVALNTAETWKLWNDRADGSSNGYCEACHGDVKELPGSYHTAGADCTGCHSHQGTAGNYSFEASCDGCHTFPPAWGSHQAHLSGGRMLNALNCSTCHDTAVHLSGTSEISFDGGDSRTTGATYVDADQTSRYRDVAGTLTYAGTPAYTSCGNLYCHSNASPTGGSISYSNPTWGGAAMTCSSCHDGGGATSSLSVRHRKHTDAGTYGYDCSKCHTDTVSDSSTISGPGKHVNSVKDVAFAETAGQTGSYNSATLACSSTYCHSDGAGGAPNTTPQWSGAGSLGCTGCHNGRIADGPAESQMDSNAHHRLANESWIRKYPCQYCHAATVDADGNIVNYGNHADGEVDIQFDPKWNIVGYNAASYNPAPEHKTCDNLYCHSDGTTVNPEVRLLGWASGLVAECDSCHGHQGECSDCHINDGITGWGPDDEWKKATPMYANTGPGTDRANSHVRHLQTDFSCANCHASTVVDNCEDCHQDGAGLGGGMTESSHIFPEYHVNKQKDVVFKDGGSYDPVTKTCSNTTCHSGDDPVWGDSANNAVLCLTCHGTTGADVDDFGGFNGTQARINMTEWVTSGHGRPAAAGNYPSGNATESGNPPADFPGNPCWYCHDNEVLHKDITNPYRLKHHPQFEKRFLKECVYCHMERTEEECRTCHDSEGSISHQLVDITGTDAHDGFPYTVDHAPFAAPNTTSCLTSDCHLPQEASQCHTCHENPADTSGAPQLDDPTIREGLAGELYSVATIQVGTVNAPYAVNHIEFMTGGSYQATSCMATPADWPPTGCHTDDVHIHNTGAGKWTAEQKEDVRSQYVMMGVCLQCHDDDDNNRCNSCHTWSGAPEDNPYTLGYDPGTGFHTGASNASSTHFGFKHFEAYEHSLGTVLNTATLSSDARVDAGGKYTELKDVSKTWSVDQFVGKAVEITSGAESGKIRPVLVNGYNSVTVSGVYNSAPLSGVTFKVLDTEWRGGKFCWDCHDPHGDGNIFMIQSEIATRTDGLFGKPLERAAVSFTRTISGLDYAKNDAPYNGICNVCHTDVDHYHKDYGDAHRSGRRCTSCHNHGFDEGHGSGQSCTECHAQKPVPNHLGFGQPRDCTKCHDGAVNGRTDTIRQFRGQSHHVQDVELSNKHCYECHWEATSHGLIDNRFHAGYNYKTHASVLNAKVDLTIYGAEKRPTEYVLDSTATIFNAVSIGTAAERENVGNVTKNCIGCHSDQNNDYEPFQDCKTPRQYAWDRTSIDARYSQEGVVNFGKHGDANAAKKIQSKAFSAHGRATLNEGGWSATTGEDGTLPNTRNGSQNVQCFDCHSSHGSYTTGVTSSYRTFDNTFRGGNLKETQAGKGGYGVTYKAAAVADGAGVVNPMNPGAAQCFDCHETQNAGAKPWGYQSTFGATAPIMGYWDSPRFGGGMNGTKTRFAYRAGMMGKGGHLKPSEPLDNAGGVDGTINGLCSGCHDPHGVSPSLSPEEQEYAVPLLKGTWLTSPYKEDFPQTAGTQKNSSNVQLDRKLFGTSNAASNGPSLKMDEDADRFAGLCIRCHPKASLTDGINKNTSFKSVDRIHETVKGWGNNSEHNFSCSKCHQPHSSGLGKLMRTNCLDSNHRAQVASGGVPGRNGGTQSYPRLKNVWPACHETMTGAWNNQRWNDVTPW
ncbi:CxxxxCH/CxxCH domain c-type cytochrome [Trichloromonas sp.]|uniref:CxxxxCH/CxxCH domain c-type cytochrome n=1 Tax=Trichloromonas sp. TaxID=3069249 RepID=UPI003D81B6DF